MPPRHVVAPARAALLAAEGAPVTLGATPQYMHTDWDDLLTRFSSRGPTTIYYRVKRDLVARAATCSARSPPRRASRRPCWSFANGTSMAAPHVSGAAAVVLAQHPTWTASAVKSALVNTAQRTGLHTYLDECCETAVTYGPERGPRPWSVRRGEVGLRGPGWR